MAVNVLTFQKITIAGTEFDGPVFRHHHVPNDPGLYLVLRVTPAGRWHPIDFGSSNQLFWSIDSADRYWHWRSLARPDLLGFATRVIDPNSPQAIAILGRLRRLIPPTGWEQITSHQVLDLDPNDLPL